MPTKVGGPADITRLTADGPEWLQRKDQCPAQHPTSSPAPLAPSSPWLKGDEGIDPIDPVYYTPAWPWDDARTGHARRSCGLRRTNCLSRAGIRSIND